MIIKVDDVIINSDYIGYAYVIKRDDRNQFNWVLHIRFMNHNKYEDSLDLRYETKQEAKDMLKKLEEQLTK